MLKNDLHVHSIHSGHAYGTIYEIVEEAENKNMDIIGICDHGPAMEGSAPPTHFLMGSRLPDFDIKVLWGCEANILNGEGKTDLPYEKIERLDYASVSLHPYCGYRDLGKEKNTDALIQAMKHPKIKFLSHPTHQNFSVEMDRVIEAAVERDVWLEINLSYLEKNLDKIRDMIQTTKSLGGTFIINSDAHFLEEIGDDSVLEKIELDLDDGEVINKRINPKNVEEHLAG